MPWGGDTPPFGFSTSGRSWLPMPAEWAALTAEEQLRKPDSMLSLYRRTLGLRRTLSELAGSSLEWVPAAEGCLAYRRGTDLLVVLNASDTPHELPAGELVLSSGPVGEGVLPADTAAWIRQAPVG
jgi:alpha-glucosidase